MAIDDTNVIDAMGISNGNTLRLLLCDHLAWDKSENTLSEADHLMLLQEKINAYLSFIESKQYKSQHPDIAFQKAVIQINFKYDLTDHCKKFLNVAQSQIEQYGIEIETHISS